MFSSEIALPVNIPKPLITYDIITSNPMEPILTYLYNNQQLSSIESYINEKSVMHIYSLADSLEMTKLLNDLQHKILASFLNPSSAINFYYEGLHFQNKELEHKAKEIMVAHFEEAVSSKQSEQIFCALPLQIVLPILNDDSLNVTNEAIVKNTVKEYIKDKDSLPIESEQISPKKLPNDETLEPDTDKEKDAEPKEEAKKEEDKTEGEPKEEAKKEEDKTEGEPKEEAKKEEDKTEGETKEGEPKEGEPKGDVKDSQIPINSKLEFAENLLR